MFPCSGRIDFEQFAASSPKTFVFVLDTHPNMLAVEVKDDNTTLAICCRQDVCGSFFSGGSFRRIADIEVKAPIGKIHAVEHENEHIYVTAQSSIVHIVHTPDGFRLQKVIPNSPVQMTLKSRSDKGDYFLTMANELILKKDASSQVVVHDTDISRVAVRSDRVIWLEKSANAEEWRIMKRNMGKGGKAKKSNPIAPAYNRICILNEDFCILLNGQGDVGVVNLRSKEYARFETDLPKKNFSEVQAKVIDAKAVIMVKFDFGSHTTIYRAEFDWASKFPTGYGSVIGRLKQSI